MRDSRRRPKAQQFRPSNQTYREMYGNEKGVYVRSVREDESNQRIVMCIGADVSDSMEEHWEKMEDYFNGIMMHSFQQVAKEYRRVLRVGAVVFAKKIVPIWAGFEDIETITGSKDHKLTQSIIKKADGKRTALHRTMIECLKHSATAAKQLDSQRDMPGNPAKIKICIMTDGANNEDPLDAAAVKEITRHITDRRQVQLVLAYFKTGYGLSFDEFQTMCKTTGFDDEPYYFDQVKGDKEERAEAFRHFFKIISGRLSRNLAPA